MARLRWIGFVIPLWLCIGVIISANLYPDYSHTQQALSELHALGSPIAQLSPMLNNYPLGLLFLSFGLLVWKLAPNNLLRATSICIALHGLGTWVAGYFPCDVGCNPNSELTSQLIHNTAGAIMSLALLLAPIMWAISLRKERSDKLFFWLTLATIIGQLIPIPAMIEALESGGSFGLYQRISYGFALAWLPLLSMQISSKIEPRVNSQTRQ